MVEVGGSSPLASTKKCTPLVGVFFGVRAAKNLCIIGGSREKREISSVVINRRELANDEALA